MTAYDDDIEAILGGGEKAKPVPHGGLQPVPSRAARQAAMAIKQRAEVKASTTEKGVLSAVSQSYSLFRPDGTPVRATLGCTFTELDRGAQRLARRTAAVARLRVVCLGDTLQGIAAEVYGDARRWRDIALLNDITNPRALVPGRVLRLPA